MSRPAPRKSRKQSPVPQVEKLRQAAKDTGAESTEVAFTQIVRTVAKSESPPSKISGKGRSN
jgi:hypothetical protein